MSKNNSNAEITYLRAKDLAKRLSISTATVWRLAANEGLPKPRKLTPSITVWSIKDIEAWEAQL